MEIPFAGEVFLELWLGASGSMLLRAGPLVCPSTFGVRSGGGEVFLWPSHPGLQCGHAQGGNEMVKANGRGEGDLVRGPTSCWHPSSCSHTWCRRVAVALCSHPVPHVSGISSMRLFLMGLSFLSIQNLETSLGCLPTFPLLEFWALSGHDFFLWLCLIASRGHDAN